MAIWGFSDRAFIEKKGVNPQGWETDCEGEATSEEEKPSEDLDLEEKQGAISGERGNRHIAIRHVARRH